MSQSRKRKEPESNELIPLPPNVYQIVSEYVGGDIKIPPQAIVNKIFLNKPGNPTLFGSRISDLLTQLLKRAANLILHGGEQEAEKVVEIVQYNPEMLLEKTEGMDAHGNIVKGTLVQIALMAGDLNIIEADVLEDIPIIHQIKHLGLMERLLLVGMQSSLQQPLKNQLKDVDIDAVNHSLRTQTITRAIIQFGENILRTDSDLEYERFVTIFNDALKHCVIQSTFVLDLDVLVNAANWFYENRHLFHPQQIRQFWEDGFAQLLNHLSARDKQLLQAGVFSDEGMVEYDFEQKKEISEKQYYEELANPQLPMGKIYLSPNGNYIVRNVNNEVHYGQVEYDRVQNEHSLNLHLNFRLNRKALIEKIAMNNHVEVIPKTTPARYLTQDMPLEDHLLLLLRPIYRSQVRANPTLLPNILKAESKTIALHLSSHRLYKCNNYANAKIQLTEKLATLKQKPHYCGIM